MSDQPNYFFFSGLNIILKNSNAAGRHLLMVAIAIGLMVTLSACGSRQSDTVQVEGQLNTANSGRMPKNASARISLVQHAGDKGHIVVEQTLHGLGKPPVKFNLDVRRALLTPGGQYGLNAEILNADGNVIWQTPVPQSVQPLASTPPAPSSLMLQRVSDTQDVEFVNFVCADKFSFGAARQNKQALVHLGRRQLKLAAEASAGTRTATYTDDHKNSLTFKKDSVALTLDGVTHSDCHSVPAHAEQPAKPEAVKGDNDSNNTQPAENAGGTHDASDNSQVNDKKRNKEESVDQKKGD
ncbi:MAG: YbaY family lipoprotein [Salinisphaera sp.]|nr:YbaY family lipoprotein [Salinisphaera sp.]